MVEACVPLLVIKNFLGHSSVETTQVYATVSQNVLDKTLIDWNEKWLPTSRKKEMKKNNIPEFLRKSFLFCKTADGATTTGKLFSLVQTARANGLKSEQYIAYVISNINKKDINDLLPWSDKLPKELLISSK